MTSAELLNNAFLFFAACEGNKGWEACETYVVSAEAPFESQAEALKDYKTIKDYTEWVKGFSVFCPGCSFDLHVKSFDETTQTAIFFGTYHAKHTADGGPCEPTNKELHSEYVYIIKMNADGKIESMKKVWNDTWALKEVGWM